MDHNEAYNHLDAGMVDLCWSEIRGSQQALRQIMSLENLGPNYLFSGVSRGDHAILTSNALKDISKRAAMILQGRKADGTPMASTFNPKNPQDVENALIMIMSQAVRLGMYIQHKINYHTGVLPEA